MAPATWLSPAVHQYSVVAAWLTSVASQNANEHHKLPPFLLLMAGSDLMSYILIVGVLLMVEVSRKESTQHGT